MFIHLTAASRLLILMHLKHWKGQLPDRLDQRQAAQIATEFAEKFANSDIAPADQTLQLARDLADFANEGCPGYDAAWA